MKSKSNEEGTPKNIQQKKPLIKIISESCPRAQASSPYLDRCFDHKVVFTKYGPQEVYVD